MIAVVTILFYVIWLGKAQQVVELTSEQVFERRFEFGAIIDVRSESEWNSTGHIEGAYLVESLASFGTPMQVTSPADMAGCEDCSILVYCNSGARARVAIQHLVDAGFTGPLYNGLGITQWLAAGYELVATPSRPPPCREALGCAAALTEQDTEGSLPPSQPPSFLPTTVPSAGPTETPSSLPSSLPSLSPPPSEEPSSPEVEVVELTSEQVFERRFEFGAIIDVRSESEWNSTGHIEGAYLVESLASFGTPMQVTSPADMAGCEDCSILVYCNSGARARVAIQHLVDAGFTGPLYNGLGITQWLAAGYELVATPSRPPPCREALGCAAALTEVSVRCPGEEESHDSSSPGGASIMIWNLVSLKFFLSAILVESFL